MAKWADYLISAVRYNTEHTHITDLYVHEDKEDSVGKGEIYSRQEIVDKINCGISVITIFKNTEGKWNKGQKVSVINVNGIQYLKTIDNGREEDNLENLPEF